MFTYCTLGTTFFLIGLLSKPLTFSMTEFGIALIPANLYNSSLAVLRNDVIFER